MKQETLNKANKIVKEMGDLNAHIENVTRVLDANKSYSNANPYCLSLTYLRSNNVAGLLPQYLPLTPKQIVDLYLQALREAVAAKQAELDSLTD